MKEYSKSHFKTPPKGEALLVFILERLDLKYQESIALSSAKKLRIFSDNEDIRISNENASNWLNERGAILWNKTQENVVKDSARIDVLPGGAGIQEKFTDDSKKTYTTTSTSCTCSFYKNHQFVCKHVLVFRRHSSLPDFSIELMHSRYHKLEMREEQQSTVGEVSSNSNELEQLEANNAMAKKHEGDVQLLEKSSVSVNSFVANVSSRMSDEERGASNAEPNELPAYMGTVPGIGEYPSADESRNTLSSTGGGSNMSVTEESRSHAAMQSSVSFRVAEKSQIIGQLSLVSSSPHHLQPHNPPAVARGSVSACSTNQRDPSNSEQHLSGDVLDFELPEVAGEEVVGQSSRSEGKSNVMTIGQILGIMVLVAF